MPFLSQKDNRETLQGLAPAKKFVEAEFSEVFDAGVGQVFDEELSISSMLNMEGWNKRKQQVKGLGESGKFNLEEYSSYTGEVDYEKLSSDFPDFGIKTDRTLFDERAELLKKRREYSKDVFERGSGMAQFLGMATSYMLDPVNIATMPVATMGTAAKSLTTIGRALTVAKNEAGLAIAAELMIQPLVYKHKHDIGSPFEFSDAITNIAMAATGAAAIGAVTGGISGYFKSVREKAVTQPLDNDSLASLQSLARVEDDLNIINKKLDLEGERIARAKEQGFNINRKVFHGTDRDFTEFDISKAGERGDDFGNYVYFSSSPEVASGFSVSLTKSDNFNRAIESLKESISKRNKAVIEHGPDSKQRIEAQKIVDEAEAERRKIYDQANEFIEPTTGSNVRPAYLKGDYLEFDAKGVHYSKVNKKAIKLAKSKGKDGVIIKNSFDRATTKSNKQSDVTVVFDANNIRSAFDNFEHIKNDVEHLTKIQNKMEAVNPPSKKAVDYQVPEREPASSGTVGQRERAVLERKGIKKDYDADIEAFNALEEPRIVQGDELVDAGDFMKSIDDEIIGMDDVLRCAIG